MKIRYSNRAFLYAPLFALLALAVASGLQWRAVAGGLETWLQQHNGREIAPGVTLRFASETVGGFPFNVDVVLHDVTFQVRSARTSGRWHTDAFAIHELTYGRALQIYEAAGTQTVSWQDAEGGAHHIQFVPGSLRASAIHSHGRLVRFDFDIDGIGSREISGVRMQLHFRKAPDRDAIDVAASADDLHLGRNLQAGFGANLRRADVEGSLAPSAPFAALFEGRETWERALEAWRQSKGEFHLNRLEAVWDGVQVQANGRLGLDDAHRPQGSLSLGVTGAVKGGPAAGQAGHFARALAELTKDAATGPRSLSASIVGGAVNLQTTKLPRSESGAGSLGPIY
jgi:Uncharacterized protein conserved in bacteria (DUF2125)